MSRGSAHYVAGVSQCVFVYIEDQGQTETLCISIFLKKRFYPSKQRNFNDISKLRFQHLFGQVPSFSCNFNQHFAGGCIIFVQIDGLSPNLPTFSSSSVETSTI